MHFVYEQQAEQSWQFNGNGVIHFITGTGDKSIDHKVQVLLLCGLKHDCKIISMVSEGVKALTQNTCARFQVLSCRRLDITWKD